MRMLLIARSGWGCNMVEKVYERSVGEFADDKYGIYAKTTIENRALPALYDGLKMVHRRTLYSMYDLGLTSTGAPTKTARVTGNTIGKFHPHGDKPVDDAISTLVRSSASPILGTGNWGTMVDEAASSRYTNCTLSRYAELVFFDPRYTAVMDMVPNYDGKDVEPVVLPALLPNLLLNGGDGIAVGATMSCPQFDLNAVCNAVIATIKKGEVLTPKECARILNKANFPFGGHFCLTDKKNKADLVDYFTTGDKTLTVGCDYTVTGNEMLLHGFAPPYSTESAYLRLLNALRQDDRIDSAFDATDSKTGKVVAKVVFRKIRGHKGDYVEEAQAVYDRYLVGTKTYKTNLTLRSLVDGKAVSTFKTTTIPEILFLWCEARMELEKKSLSHQISSIKNQLNRLRILLLACKHRNIVLKAMTVKNPAEYLMKELTLEQDEADYILDQPVRRLTRLSEDDLFKKHKEENRRLAELQKIDIKDKVIQETERLRSLLSGKKEKKNG